MAKNAAPIEINSEFQRAWEIMENTSHNVFITGRAGTGKSTLLKYWRDRTKKKIVVLAPTGVAALNVNGQTIHSFFGFKPDITLSKVKRLKKGFGKKIELYKKLDAIVIDEISMVRADLLDSVEQFMRFNGPNPRLPFGGAQMIFIGDLYQLPPVVSSRDREAFASARYASPYFFSSRVFAPGALFDAGLPMDFVELEKVYRQTDGDFIALLNSIRNNSAAAKEIAALNQRYDNNFKSSANDCYIYLTATNDAARLVNEQKLTELKTKEYVFNADISGKFEANSYPTDERLRVKAGAQVMLLNNDAAGRWVNGTIGRVVDIKNGAAGKIIEVLMPGGETEPVIPHEWDIFSYLYDNKTGQIETDTVGTFTQYPLRLAWAVTIHKSQGKTFDKVIVDVGRGTFAHGQMYVALSRCTSFGGLVLKQKLEKRHILMDWKVVQFLTRYQYGLADKLYPLADKIEIIKNAIKQKQPLKIVYLKSNDTKSRRQIIPKTIGEMEYNDKAFLGLVAFCAARQEDRTFRVDRILEIES
ncbi:MAG: AAA family ATPase [bacterium]|nr:AAA family ATPase [bacterium]